MSRFNSDLLQFAEEGNIGECARLLDAGLDINCKDINRQTPLMKALGAQQETAALFLIERGAQLDTVAIDGGSPMHKAAWHGLDGAVAAMHLRGADVNVVAARDGSRPIGMAVMTSSESTVRLLAKLGADPKIVYSEDEDGLLHLAARASLEMLSTVTELGLDPDVSNKQGLAPIHTMALMGRTGHVLKMLDTGADPLKSVDGDGEHAGKSAAELADGANHPDTAAALRAWMANKEARKALGDLGMSP